MVGDESAGLGGTESCGVGEEGCRALGAAALLGPVTGNGFRPARAVGCLELRRRQVASPPFRMGKVIKGDTCDLRQAQPVDEAGRLQLRGPQVNDALIERQGVGQSAALLGPQGKVVGPVVQQRLRSREVGDL